MKKSTANFILSLIIGVPLFLGLVPFLIYFFGKKIDKLLAIKPVFTSWTWKLLAAAILFFGFYFAFWSVFTMIFRHKGFPVSINPKGELITDGPYAFSRNPMWFGTAMIYTGFALFTSSLGAILIVLAMWILFPLYLKFVEEKHLIKKFGDQYLEYKAKTPMLFPKFQK